MFKKWMAKLGKGGAKVDLVLNHQAYRPGDEVQGELVIRGGTVEQEINRIDVELVMTVRLKEKEISHAIASFPFHESFTIHPEEQKTLPFSCTLPTDIPVSGNHVVYHFVTHLDIAAGVDHSDLDYIQVLPPERLQRVLDAFTRLDFREKNGSRSFNGYVQEFEWFPGSFLRDQVEEVEFVALLEEDGIRLFLEVDLYSWQGEKEIYREVHFSNDRLDQPDSLTETLRQILQEMVANPPSFARPWFDPSLRGVHKYRSLSRSSGAIGGFAAGLIGGMILAEVMDEMGEAMEEAAGVELDSAEDLLGDIFDGGDE